MSRLNRKRVLHALLAIAAFVMCDVGTARSQVSQPSMTNKRYLVYGGAGGDYPPLSTFTGAVDEAINDGFNAIRLHVPWKDTQGTNGVWDFSALDQEVAYVVGAKNLPVAFMIDLTRPSSDGRDSVLSPNDVMQNSAGEYCGQSWGGPFINQPSFV